MSEATPDAKALFGQALEIEAPDERAAFLDRACSANRALRAEVAGLLEALARAGDFMGAPPAGTVSHTYRGEGPGGRIGPYKLLQQLGAGGMGVVWLAEQEQPVRRTVALKLIRPGMDSRQVVARFDAERQALALMDHPNIARVFDAGATEADRPYFVMELVLGVPLTTYCDNNRLTPRQRLELFLPVCQAVQHAHQKGIIHRDLKPSNVLVALYDGKPVPKVIDFGVAKATDRATAERALSTQFGAIVGTFEYMAPEQAELGAPQVDTRSDVYSLGVLLYELLTGTTPLGRDRLRQEGLYEVLRLIREEEPPRPSTRLSESGERLAAVATERHTEPARLTRLVRGELDWIVLKALEKDWERRYQTANGLARDLERYLNDEPVEACPPSAGYRLRKFARKNRRLLGVLAGFAALLLAGTVLSTWLALRASWAEQQATDALGRVTRQQAETEAALGRAGRAEREALDALADATRARTRTRQALDTLTENALRDLLGRRPLLGPREKAFLRKVQSTYEGFAAEPGKTEEDRAVVADGQYRLASLRDLLGETAAAEAGYRSALKLYAELAAQVPAVPAYRWHQARVFQALGALLGGRGERDAAHQAFDQAIARFEQLVREFPRAPDYRMQLARSHGLLGLLLRDLGRRTEAVAAQRLAVAGSEKLVADYPQLLDYRQDLADALNDLADVHFDLGEWGPAESACLRATTLAEGLLKHLPGVAEHRQSLARSLSSLARVLKATGKATQAVATFRKALTVQEALASEFPAVPAFRRELGTLLKNLFIELPLPGGRAEAEALGRRAVAIHRRLAAEFPGVAAYRGALASSQHNLGFLFQRLAKTADADAAYLEAITLSAGLAKEFPNVPAYGFALAATYVNRGHLLRAQGRAGEALALIEKALPLLRADDARMPQVRSCLRGAHAARAEALMQLRRPAEAVKAWERAAALEGDARQRNFFRLNQAGSLAQAGHHDRADALLDDVTRGNGVEAEVLYNAARVCALCSLVTGKDTALCERYAARAIALLGRTRDVGYFQSHERVAFLQGDRHFGPLRQREDFRKFVAALRAAAAK